MLNKLKPGAFIVTKNMTSIHFGIQLSGGIIESFVLTFYVLNCRVFRERQRDQPHILFPF